MTQKYVVWPSDGNDKPLCDSVRVNLHEMFGKDEVLEHEVPFDGILYLLVVCIRLRFSFVL